MAAFSSIMAGVGAGAGLLGGLFGGKGGSSSSTAWIEMAMNAVRQQQMNIDATRRRRDVIRQAQVAGANATAVAYNQGAGNSSALTGALGQIAGQEGVNIQGIEQNRQLGNEMFALNTMRGKALMDKSAADSKAYGIRNVFGALGKAAPVFGQFADYGWGKLGGAFSSTANSWNNSYDIYQVGGGD